MKKKCFIFAPKNDEKLSMKGYSVIAQESRTGYCALYETLEAAAESLGTTSSAVSIACRDGRECRGWMVRRVERVYAVKTRVRQDWVICTRDVRGRYIEYGNPVRVMGEKEMDQVREITMGWHLAQDLKAGSISKNEEI